MNSRNNMIRYKINVYEELQQRGISSYTIKKNNLMSQSTLSKLKNNDTSITLSSLDKICQLLQCDISDVVEYKEP